MSYKDISPLRVKSPSQGSLTGLRKRLSSDFSNEHTGLSTPNPPTESDTWIRDGTSATAGTSDSSSLCVQDEADSFLVSKVSAAVEGDLRQRHSATLDQPPSSLRRRSIPVKLEKAGQAGQCLLIAGDAELQNTLRQRIEREEFGNIKSSALNFGTWSSRGSSLPSIVGTQPAHLHLSMASLLFFFGLGVALMLISRCQQLENLWNCVGEERNFAVNVSQGCPSTWAH